MTTDYGFQESFFASDSNKLNVPAGTMRALPYLMLGGREGVGSPDHLRVLATTPTTGRVLVTPGVVAIKNRYETARIEREMYVANYAQQVELNIDATGGTARSDLVIARIIDPDFSGEAPSTFVLEVVKGVPAGTTSVVGLGLSSPAYPLARIDIPISTATITQSMIKRLGALTNPRRAQDGGTFYPTTPWNVTTVAPVTLAVGATVIPAWATRINWRLDIGGPQAGGGTAGNWTCTLGPYGGQGVAWQNGSTGQMRMSYVVPNIVVRTPAGADQTATVSMGCNRNTGTNPMIVDQYTSVQWAVDYAETLY